MYYILGRVQLFNDRKWVDDDTFSFLPMARRGYFMKARLGRRVSSPRRPGICAGFKKGVTAGEVQGHVIHYLAAFYRKLTFNILHDLLSTSSHFSLPGRRQLHFLISPLWPCRLFFAGAWLGNRKSSDFLQPGEDFQRLMACPECQRCPAQGCCWAKFSGWTGRRRMVPAGVGSRHSRAAPRPH